MARKPNTRRMADNSMKALPIAHVDRDADSVNTVELTFGFKREHGIENFMLVSDLFVAAHSELGITLKWDRKTNHGWVTSVEAAAIRAHMLSNLSK